MTPLRSAGLGAWLGAGSVVIVLLAVVSVATSSIGLLGKLAEQQAMTRVELAGASAHGVPAPHRRGRAQRHPRAGRAPDAAPPAGAGLPARHRRRSCSAPARPAASMPARSLSAKTASSAAGGADSLGRGGRRAVRAGRAVPRRLAGQRAAADRRLGGGAAPGGLHGSSPCSAVDDKLLAEITRAGGRHASRITNYATYMAPPDDPFTELHTEALSSGRVAARRLKSPNVYAATLPWSAVTGEMIGLIDVADRLPPSSIPRSGRLAWRLAAIALRDPGHRRHLAASSTANGWCGR